MRILPPFFFALAVVTARAQASVQYFEAGAGLDYTRLSPKSKDAGEGDGSDDAIGMIGFAPCLGYMMKNKSLGYGLGLSLPWAYYSKSDSCGSGCSVDATIWAWSAEPELRVAYDVTSDFLVGSGLSYSFLVVGKYSIEGSGAASGTKLDADLAGFSQLRIKLLAGYNVSPQSYVEGALSYIPKGSIEFKLPEDSEGGKDDITGFGFLLGYRYRFVDELETQVSPTKPENRGKMIPRQRPGKRIR